MIKMFQIAWKHIRRSPYQALAALVIMALTFFIISVFVLLSFGSEKILNYFETRPQITAFLKDDVSKEEIEALKTQLVNTGKVASIKYVSKEEALAIYREQNKDDPLLLELVTADILPASIDVSAVDSPSLTQLAEILKGAETVEEVLFHEDVVATLTSWTQTIRRAGLVLVVFLIVVSLLVISIIVGMKISVKKEEIEILRLLGASSGYIRNPFLLEGAFYGIFGALLAWAVAYLCLLYATPFLTTFLGEISLLPIPLWFMFSLLGSEAFLGFLIGSLASFLAVRRYLR